MLGSGTSYSCLFNFRVFTCTVGEYSTLGLTHLSWLNEVGLYIYHCRMEVVLAAFMTGFCNACQGHPTFIVWVWCTALFVGQHYLTMLMYIMLEPLSSICKLPMVLKRQDIFCLSGVCRLKSLHQ